MRRSCSGRHMRPHGMSANEARVALPVIAAMPTALMIAFMFGNVIGMDFTGLLLSFMLLAFAFGITSRSGGGDDD